MTLCQQNCNHQASQFSIHIALVVLNAPVTHLAATQHVLSELHEELSGNLFLSEKGTSCLSWKKGAFSVIK